MSCAWPSKPLGTNRLCPHLELLRSPVLPMNCTGKRWDSKHTLFEKCLSLPIIKFNPRDRYWLHDSPPKNNLSFKKYTNVYKEYVNCKPTLSLRLKIIRKIPLGRMCTELPQFDVLSNLYKFTDLFGNKLYV